LDEPCRPWVRHEAHPQRVSRAAPKAVLARTCCDKFAQT
jgi:hypothetical protein